MNAEAGQSPGGVFGARLLAVVGAIASGVGVAGFSAVVGGVVVWLRFDALGLPANAAVAAMPRTELIVIGVSTLLPFIALGLAVVVLAYVFAANNLVPSRSWVDLPAVWSGTELAPGNDPPPGTPGLPLSPEAEAKARLAKLAHDACEAAARASAAGKVGRPTVVDEQVSLIAEAESALTNEFKWLTDLPDGTPSELMLLKPVLTQVSATVAAAKNRAGSAKREAQERQGRSRTTLIVSTLLLLAIEMALVIARGAPSLLQTLLLAAIGLLLTLTTLRLAWSTPGFAIFGTSIFVSILLFGTATTLLGTYHVPKVQPTAVLRSGHDAGLTGYFVAQTSESIYLVRILGKQEGGHFNTSFPRLVVVPRSNVVAMEIGPLELQQRAYGTSYQELRELCGQKIAEAPAAKGTPEVVCGQQPGLVEPKSLAAHRKGSQGSTKAKHRASQKKQGQAS